MYYTIYTCIWQVHAIFSGRQTLIWLWFVYIHRYMYVLYIHVSMYVLCAKYGFGPSEIFVVQISDLYEISGQSCLQQLLVFHSS